MASEPLTRDDEVVRNSKAATQRAFATFAWGCLGYNLLVILWGAVVRATGSGAGCGSHWPKCNGEVLPTPKSVATMIEFSHRATSGIALALTVVAAVWAFYAFPPRHQVRRLALLSLFFMLGEALIGAGLVLLALVAHDQSLRRVVSMSLHLVNTFLLLGALTWTASIARGGAVRPAFAGRRNHVYCALLAILFPVGVSGGIAALGDTVFPAKSLAEGMGRDFSAAGHLYERLRVFHPFIALITAALLLIGMRYLSPVNDDDGAETQDPQGPYRVSAAASQAANPQRAIGKWTRVVMGITVLQVVWGAGNLILLAPMLMQLGHLLLADLLWISLMMLGHSLWSLPGGRLPKASFPGGQADVASDVSATA